MVVLVHHGDAVLATVDPSRPLSPGGRSAAQRLAGSAAARGVRPECVWHSGKLRARQTAEIFWRACNPLATMTAERGLQPGDPPEWMRERLFGDTRELLIVGHMPHLARLLRLMIAGDADNALVTYPPHGVVALDASDERWIERWRLEVMLNDEC